MNEYQHEIKANKHEVSTAPKSPEQTNKRKRKKTKSNFFVTLVVW